jgi:NADPH-dependent 2,4-dienoyl-CoA reductase/sulfur reductase-like enzyme/rhodanese-related sulfurtransferase
MKTIIVGGVAGGMSAATRLRRLDESAEIVIFEQGPYVSFANCGLPYFIGGIIEDRSQLLLQTPQSLGKRFNLDVRVNTRVTSIDPVAKTVTVRQVETGEESTESYDSLILSPGAKPRELDIPGFDRALTLRNVPDADRIAEAVNAKPNQNVVILGAGFIGIEVAENLRHAGHNVTIVQSQGQVLPQFDIEMIEPFQRTLEANGVNLILGVTAAAITQECVTLSNGDELAADVVISSVGVVPDHVLAVEAGLRIGDAGGIWVDEFQRTSDPNIYAVGDAAEKTNSATGDASMVWLANLANRHGRLVADVIAGEPVSARPSIGTGIIGAFGNVAAVTGLTESQATRAGLAHSVIHLHPGSHAGYYPGAETIALKVIFHPTTGKLLGAQAVGFDGADKRIDVIATAIYAGLTVDDLMNLELAYAPQFGSAKDAVNQAGYVGNNVLSGRTPSVQWHEIDARVAAGAMILDVRTESENAADSIVGSTLVPVDSLRERIAEIPADREVIVHCKVGQRGHTATQVLRAHGINAVNLDGGFLTWNAATSARSRATNFTSS